MKISILDLVRITHETGAAQALHNARDLAQHAENWGYERFWVAEHHNIPSVASAATSVVIGHIAEGTSRIRVGAGGIMLPNHAPLVIAEQFGTLELLHPGRIDLGLGRAPGTGPATVRALRRSAGAAEHFAEDVREIQTYLGEGDRRAGIEAVPATGTQVPLWILGSSLYGARLAARYGLPYAFASHFAPQMLVPALQTYRQEFRPSAQLEAPYAMVGVNAIAADTEREAQRLFTTQQMTFVDLFRDRHRLAQPPIDNIDAYWSSAEKAQAQQMLACSVVGTPGQVEAGLAQLVEETGADELILVADIYDHQARLYSLEQTARSLGRTS